MNLRDIVLASVLVAGGSGLDYAMAQEAKDKPFQTESSTTQAKRKPDDALYGALGSFDPKTYETYNKEKLYQKVIDEAEGLGTVLEAYDFSNIEQIECHKVGFLFNELGVAYSRLAENKRLSTQERIAKVQIALKRYKTGKSIDPNSVHLNFNVATSYVALSRLDVSNTKQICEQAASAFEQYFKVEEDLKSNRAKYAVKWLSENNYTERIPERFK